MTSQPLKGFTFDYMPLKIDDAGEIFLEKHETCTCCASPEEHAYVTRRLELAAKGPWQALKESIFGNAKDKIDAMTKQPRIAILFSGGGCRSAVASAGYARALHKRGIMDNATHASAISGGAWYLLHYLQYGGNGDGDKFNIDEILKGIEEATSESLSSLIFGWYNDSYADQYRQALQKAKVPVNAVDKYAFLLMSCITKHQRKQEDIDAFYSFSGFRDKPVLKNHLTPYPILSCVRTMSADASAIQKNDGHHWLEFTPHYTSYSQIPTMQLRTELLGINLDNGEPQMDHERDDLVSFLAAICGSAFNADIQAEIARKIGFGKPDLYPEVEQVKDMDSGAAFPTIKPDDDELTVLYKLFAAEEDPEPEQDKDIFTLAKYGLSIVGNVLRRNIAAPRAIPNFHYGMNFTEGVNKVAKDERVILVDGGIVLNVPIAPFLRQDRQADILFVFDNSAGSFCLSEIIETASRFNRPFPWVAKWRKHRQENPGSKLPEIQTAENWPVPTAMIPEEEDGEGAPIVVFFPLLQNDFSSYPNYDLLYRNKPVPELLTLTDAKNTVRTGTFQFKYEKAERDRIFDFTELVFDTFWEEIRLALKEAIKRVNAKA